MGWDWKWVMAPCMFVFQEVDGKPSLRSYLVKALSVFGLGYSYLLYSVTAEGILL